jgi:acetyl-CoA carboxylase biotin carboxylase subunit
VLVANRGEIALRIVRGARELGIRSVAVYSEADRMAPHVLEADEAYEVGPPPASESYLRGDKLIEVAKRAGADAVHPGYGFLAERADFARAVEAAGLVFVGPSPEAIAAMGDKAEARRRVADAGLAIVPGLAAPAADAEEAAAAAAEIGFPVLLKPATGGGGKGMRVVREPAELVRSFEAASREAQAAFGDGRVYLERCIERPRHVEIQVLGDAHGNVVHLGERECSIQRRHQKLVEEAPAPDLPRTVREAMGEAAVRAAQAVGYRSAGTVEFLYHDGDFYFLEMNTRLQVEHPVTELVTGVDLVEWQLRVAAGERLGFAQDDVSMRGHAIECRITSEDPGSGFLPSTGVISYLEVPAGPGVRWDGGVRAGLEVTLHYDPLLAKLITYGRDRATAIERMARALDELVVDGVETSAPFLRNVMDEPDFRAGRLSTAYVEEHAGLLEPAASEEELVAAAVAGALLEEEHRTRHRAPRVGENGARTLSAWRAAGWPWEADS